MAMVMVFAAPHSRSHKSKETIGKCNGTNIQKKEINNEAARLLNNLTVRKQGCGVGLTVSLLDACDANHLYFTECGAGRIRAKANEWMGLLCGMFKICHYSRLIQSQICWKSQCLVAYSMFPAWNQKRSVFLQTCSHSAWEICQIFSDASFAAFIQQKHGKLSILENFCDTTMVSCAADLYLCALTNVWCTLPEKFKLWAGQNYHVPNKGSFKRHLVMLQDPVLAAKVGWVRETHHHCSCVIYLFHVSYLF